MQSKTGISAAVNVFNAEKHIPTLLDSLLRQSLPPLEIIIVDDGSTDNTVKAIQKYLNIKKPKVKLYKLQHVGLNIARKYAWSKCKYDFILSADADEYFAPDVVRILAETLIKNKDTAIAGAKIVAMHKTPFTKALDFLEDYYRTRKVAKDGTARWVKGGALIFKRILLKDLVLTPPIGEDIVMCAHAQNKNYIVKFCGDAVVEHDHPCDIRKHMKREYAVGLRTINTAKHVNRKDYLAVILIRICLCVPLLSLLFSLLSFIRLRRVNLRSIYIMWLTHIAWTAGVIRSLADLNRNLVEKMVTVKLAIQEAWGWLAPYGVLFLVASQLQEKATALGIKMPLWAYVLIGTLLLVITGATLMFLRVFDVENSIRTRHNQDLHRLFQEVNKK